MDLVDRISRWAAAAPGRTAHVSGGQEVTYGELLRLSDLVASHVAKSLPHDRSPVAVKGHKEPGMLACFLGSVKAGHPYIPIDVSIPAKRVEDIIAAARVRLVVDASQVTALATAPTGASDSDAKPLGPDDPFYMIFTSGSTGEPKGVVITLGCLTAFVDWMRSEQGFAEQREVFLNQAPFSFDLSVMDLYLSLTTGGTLFSLTRDDIADPRQMYRVLSGSGVTSWVSTPSFAGLCLMEKAFNSTMMPSLMRFMFCGETLSPEVATLLLDRFPCAQVWNLYGPTEATVATTSVLITREVVHRYQALPVGYSMPGTQVMVVDEDGQPAPEGDRGEIVIAGPNVSPGYLGRPDLTARSFFTFNGVRAYRTGDLGRMQGGLLFFEGRMDSQIKLHGYRIELGDVEANLRAIAEVKDCTVLPIEKNGQTDSLAAFVVLASGLPVSEFKTGVTLRQRLAERLPAYMVPRKFRFLNAFPMTPNGKIDKTRLLEGLHGPLC